MTRLVPLPAERFPAWAEHSARGFAEQQLLSGTRTRAEAGAYATEQLAALLPQGVSTPGHHVWELHDDTAAGDVLVGHLWLGVHDRVGYLYDIEVLPDARGRGLGRASMRAVEGAARDLGADLLRINVFGHNAVARGLYERLGYDVVRAVHTRTLARLDARERPAEPVLTRPAQVNPGHEVWTASGNGRSVGSACLHWVREGTGLRVDAHDVRAHGTEPVLLLRALAGLAAERGAAALAAEVGDVPGGAAALAAAGFTLTAELREKVLARA